MTKDIADGILHFPIHLVLGIGAGNAVGVILAQHGLDTTRSSSCVGCRFEIRELLHAREQAHSDVQQAEALPLSVFVGRENPGK